VPQAVLAAHVTQTPEPVTTRRPAVPAPVGAVVMRCLEKRAADRFQSARELLAHFEMMATPSGGMPPTASLPATSARPTAGWRWPRLAAVALVLAVTAISAWAFLSRDQARAMVIAPATRIAVMPFAPTSADTALARLGRDLVVTLTANLEGVGDIQTVDALSVLAQVQDGAPSLADGAAVAQRLGASGFVHGSLVRLGSTVRLDLGLFNAADGESVARATVTASPDDLEALTDSTTWALLRQVWRAREAPTPNVAAVTTRSVPALRAFLEGEQAIARSEWLRAAEAFERTIAADSAFGLAYWRLAYVLNWSFLPVDSTVRLGVQRYRSGFPERDRLLAENRDREVTERFPEYWPGWMALADDLVHIGPAPGFPATEAQAGFERVVALHPSFLPGWEHLLWAAAVNRDTAVVRTAAGQLARRGYDPEGWGFDNVGRVFRYWVEGILTGRPPSPDLSDSVAQDLARGQGTVALMTLSVAATWGDGAQQLDLNRRVLRSRPLAPVIEEIRQVTGPLWASRGAWDSALAAVDQYAAASPGFPSSQSAYALATAGVRLGGVPIGEAARRRPGNGLVGNGRLVAWLDGYRAWLAKDPFTLAEGESRMRFSGSCAARQHPDPIATASIGRDAPLLASAIRLRAQAAYRFR
jgi:TolB-like protein